MDRLHEGSALYKGLSLIGLVGLALLIGVYSSGLEALPRVTLLMFCGVLVTLGLTGVCGWLAHILGRRIRFAGEDVCAFAGGLAGGALLFALGYFI
ncbi:hypothetical protein [Paraburkholderia sp. HP33-1]|uniref:hypothetical protein n=1 Tax=Paraburkholderia sp. HP33-1 TaxID=2883243 RepID=UPI001F2B2C51|nr:hypothetical protein [Paraburkholderia sp. HP33-1]